VHYNLGLLFAGQKNKKREATEEFKAYLGHSPNGYNAQSARIKVAELDR
jgi:hypothetical protein